MTKSNIVTGQFVEISQTPASILARIVGRLADTIVLIIYVTGAFQLFDKIYIDGSDVKLTLYLLIVGVPVGFYSIFCEMLFHGQTLGKWLMKTRVVRTDGTSPTLGNSLLRWLLLPIDLYATSGLGALFILFTANNQRIGDLAAGTMVIKLREYRKINISLDEFFYGSRNYTPHYPAAQDLSQQQVEIIEQVLYQPTRNSAERQQQLARKVEETLRITHQEPSSAAFLETLLHDYQYYATEVI